MRKIFSRWRITAAFVVVLIFIGMTGAAFLEKAYYVPILMYHSVDHNDKITKLSVSPESFERQLAFLRRHNYNIVTLDAVARYIASGKKIPPRTVAITFDDGFYNNYENAFPILKKYSVPATIFVITSKIGEPGYLGWNELKEMSDSGLIKIASHTVTHPWLTSLGKTGVMCELRDSKKVLEDGLGRPVDALCYPMGCFDLRAEKAARDAGYICAVGTNPQGSGSERDIYAIKRIKISRTSDNLFVFWFETSGFYTWVKER